MKNPTTITKKTAKGKTATFFTIAYNGKELGKLSIYNVFTNGGTLGLRIDWNTPNEPFDPKKKYVFDFTDRDDLGNIRMTK